MSRKPNKSGRNKGSLSSFINIERYIMATVAWRSLSAVARSSYLELLHGYTGQNNGSILMSARILGDRLGMSKTTGARAILELESKGFIDIARRATFTAKLQDCQRYRLTAFKCDLTHAHAAKTFARWTPQTAEIGTIGGTLGTTGGTAGRKTTRNVPSRFHGQDREALLGRPRGTTGGTFLESNHGRVHSIEPDGATPRSTANFSDDFDPQGMASQSILDGIDLKSLTAEHSRPNWLGPVTGSLGSSTPETHAKAA